MSKKILLSLLIICCASAYAQDDKVLCASGKEDKNITQAVKWYRNSAEQNALYEQAYSLASDYVKSYVETNKPKAKSWGVSIDIDETTLDNSFYMHYCKQIAESENDFSRFIVNEKKSTALPGVVKFTNMVHSLGGYVSLVSNRDGSYKDENGDVMSNTIENLNNEGVYFDQVLLSNQKDSKDPNNKNPRFKAIITGQYTQENMFWSNKLKPHKLITYLGDNIQDFPKFKQVCKTDEEFHNRICANKDGSNIYQKFGHGLFIMPNPMYGSWQAKENN